MRRVWSVPLLLIWLLRLVISVLVRILWLVLWVVPTAILAHIIALPILFGPALGLIGEWIGIRPLLDARPMKALRAARFHAIFWFRTAPARFILDRAALLPLAVFVATVVPTIFTLFAPELLPQPSGRLSGGLSLRHREYIGIAWVVVTALVAMVGIVRERQQRAEDREEAADLKDLDPSDLQLLAPRLALVAQTISPQSLHALGVPPDFGWVVHIYGYGKKRLMPILPRPISDPNSVDVFRIGQGVVGQAFYRQKYQVRIDKALLRRSLILTQRQIRSFGHFRVVAAAPITINGYPIGVLSAAGAGDVEYFKGKAGKRLMERLARRIAPLLASPTSNAAPGLLP